MRIKLLEKLTSREHWIITLLLFGWTTIRVLLILLLYPIEYLCRLAIYIAPDFRKNSRIKQTKKYIEDHGNTLLKHNPEGYYLDKYVHNCEGQPLSVFIENFIKIYRNGYYTYVHFPNYQSAYFICGIGRRRSLGDIFLICKTYYPTCTIHNVLGILVQLLEEGKIYGSYCTTINKYVFHKSSNVYIRNDRVEYSEWISFRNIIDAYKI